MRPMVGFLLCLTLLHSTTISGEIFNGDNNQHLNNTLVTIEDSSGNAVVQKSCNGYYNLEVPTGGNYTLRAYYYLNGSLEYYTDNKFQASQESMQFDLVLIPYELQALVPGFSPPPLLNQSSGNASTLPASDQMPFSSNIVIYGIAIIAFIGALYLIYKNLIAPQQTNKNIEEKEEHALDNDCKKVLCILQENEGRMVQKELREILNFSETKMSLIVTELEALGLVKRIKKGRENILKLAR